MMARKHDERADIIAGIDVNFQEAAEYQPDSAHPPGHVGSTEQDEQVTEIDLLISGAYVLSIVEVACLPVSFFASMSVSA